MLGLMSVLAVVLNMTPQECFRHCEEVRKENISIECPAGVDEKTCKIIKENSPYKQCLSACEKLK